jgi:hypothetical protein
MRKGWENRGLHGFDERNCRGSGDGAKKRVLKVQATRLLLQLLLQRDLLTAAAVI